MKNVLLSTLISASLLLVSTVVAAQEESIESLVVAMAHTKAEHSAVARYYSAKAEEARKEVRQHQKMADSYGHSKTTNPQQMRNHCLDLAKKYGEIAADYDALAKEHQDEAQKAAQ